MNDYRAYIENDYNSLYHFGIKGQRWGIRRYQNPDGSLTPEGKKRYLNPDGSLNERGRRELKKSFGVKSSAGIAGAGALAGTYAYKKLKEAKDFALEGTGSIPRSAKYHEQLYKKHNMIEAPIKGWNEKNHVWDEFLKVANEKGYKTTFEGKVIPKDMEKLKSRSDWAEFETAINKGISKNKKMGDMAISNVNKNYRSKAVKIALAVVGATAIALYANERRKKAMRDRGEERVKQLFGEDFVYDPTTKQYVSRKK